MARFVYGMRDVSKMLPGGRLLLGGVRLQFIEGAKIGVLGPNGAGKSTLLRIMAGLDSEFQGEAGPAEGVSVGFLPQEPALDEGKTVLACALEGLAEEGALLARFAAVSEAFAEEGADLDALAAEQAELQARIDAAGAWDLEQRAARALSDLGCPPGSRLAGTLSGGERRRVALARLLLAQPGILLLDEPTNHLDAEATARLETRLREWPGTVVAATHDRFFLDRVAGWILEIDRGRAIPFEGNYSAWLEARARRLALEEKAEAARRRQMDAELEWIRAAPAALRARSKARVSAYERLAAEAEARAPEAAGGGIRIPPGPRLGAVAARAEGLRAERAGRVLFEGLDFAVPAGAVVGIVGPNGAGKTTLLRMIAGLEAPDGGRVELGASAAPALVDQGRGGLEDGARVWEAIAGGEEDFELGGRLVKTRAWAAEFGFRGADQQKRAGDLSGGERNRLHLARVLRSGANMLLLDEPTNDLDVDTLRSLEDALLAFAGCVVAVSHDRWFLARIATHVLHLGGAGRGEWFEGGLRDWEDARGACGAA